MADPFRGFSLKTPNTELLLQIKIYRPARFLLDLQDRSIINEIIKYENLGKQKRGYDRNLFFVI